MAIKNINTDLTVNGEAQIGATSYQGDMNGGKADFSVDCGGTPEISFIGNYLQAGGTDQNWTMRLYTGALQTWGQDLYITAGGTGTTSKLRLGTNGQTSTIVCDDGNVGIGTTSPAQKLQVDGNIRIESGSYASLVLDRVTTGASSIIQFENNGGIVGAIGGYLDDGLMFNTKDGTQMVISASNNVGIGTTSPAVDLEIKTATNNTSAEEGLRLYNAGGGVGAGVRIGLGVGASYIEKGHIRTDIVSGGAGRLFLGTNGTDRFVIDNTGNVGIGTTSPTAKLEVTGSLKSNNLIYNGTSGGELRIDNSSNGGIGYYADNNGHAFKTWVGSWQTQMVITDAGNVGIGTTSPNVRLELRREDSGDLFELNRPASTVSALYGGVATNHPYLYSNNGIFTLGVNNPDGGTGGEVSYITMRNGSTRYTTFEAGNVGIGTTSPSAKLHVHGTSFFFDQAIFDDKVGIGTASPNAKLDIVSTGAGSEGLRVDGASGGFAFVVKAGSDYTSHIRAGATIGASYFTTPPSNGLIIQGNVGIGTTSPDEKLDVVGTGTQLGSTGYYYNTRIKDSTNSGVLLGGNATENGVGFIAGINQLAFLTYDSGWGERMRINGGNVCIGTSSPTTIGGTAKLTVNVGSGTSTPVTIANGSTDSLYIRRYTSGGSYQLQTTSGSSNAGNLSLQSYGGNVGIGTTSPSYKLEVDGTFSSNSLWTDSSANTYWGSGTSVYGILTWNTGYASVKAGPSKDLRLGGNNSSTHMAIDTSGNVGIGDTTPSYKLDVNGTLRTTGQAYFNSNVTITGSATMAGGTMTGNLEINTDRAVYNASYFGTSTASTRSKFRLYGTDTKYAIGMQNNCTYGGLGNTWAMTFQFSNSNTRGFWWGDDGHSQAQGAMALTTDGNLTVASRIRVGYGESDTTTPATYALDATGEVAVTSGDVELTTASRGIILKSPNGTRYLVNINDSGELTTSAV
jgi:hypothetical protein